MARTKTFDESMAIDRAMNLFWEQGYEATSVRDLSFQTGIGISSLYNAFGDKHNVYGAALERYGEREREQFADELAASGPARELLAGIFAGLIDSLLSDDGGRGSFTLNAAIELGGRDPAVTRRLRVHFEAISELLAERLAIAQEAGEISAAHPPDELAHFLLMGLYALAVMVKIMPDRPRLEAQAAITLSVLDLS